MKLGGRATIRIALIEGIANVLTFISLIIFIIALGKIMFSGFLEWQKDFFLYSTIGSISFFAISRVLKQIRKYSENQ